MLIKDQTKRADCSDLKEILVIVEKMTNESKINYKVNYFRKF
jgi:hypothetical protein